MLQEIETTAAGKQYRMAMPGRYCSLEEDLAALQEAGVTQLAALTPLDEMRAKSPEYARKVAAGTFPIRRTVFEVPDFDVPSDRVGFLALARSLAGELRAGERVAIHCGAGVGRTGTLATCVLMALGQEQAAAAAAVDAAGAGPETQGQRRLVDWAAGELADAGQ